MYEVYVLSYSSFYEIYLQPYYEQGWRVISHSHVIAGMTEKYTFVLERKKDGVSAS